MTNTVNLSRGSSRLKSKGRRPTSRDGLKDVGLSDDDAALEQHHFEFGDQYAISPRRNPVSCSKVICIPFCDSPDTIGPSF